MTIAIVTKPFAFEGTPRRRVAEAAVAELATSVDAIITIPNDRVAGVAADDVSMLDAFRVVDDVLLATVQGILDLLSGTGLINLDFADVRAVMQGAGPALIGLGRGVGENRALDAARQAVASPLLEADIQGARSILFNVSGPADLQMREVRAAADEIRASADPDANVIFGASLGRRAGDEVLITLIATGLQWPEGSAPPIRAAEPEAIAEPVEPVAGVVEPPSPDTRPRKRPAKVGMPTAAAQADEPAVDEAPATPSFLRRELS